MTRRNVWMYARRAFGALAVPLAAAWTSPAWRAELPRGDAGQPIIHVVDGVAPDGASTEQWMAMLRRRLSDAQFDSVRRIHRPLSEAEAAWRDTIRTRVSAWEAMLPELIGVFEPVRPPRRVTVVLGNRGGNDAFTHDPVTIGFDLAALAAAYGTPTGERLDRLFRHEYVHLLQKARWATEPWDTASPLRYAVAEMWLEGLGNYYSMSARWRARGGRHAPAARQALDRLEPRLVARLAALACAPPEHRERLTADLSWGPFAEKWGALTPALWLELEASASPEALRRFVAAGPDGIWELAARHLSAPLRAALAEARLAAERCPRGG